MSNSLIVQSRSNGYIDNSTYFVSIAGNSVANGTTEAFAELPVRDAGTFSNLYVNVPTNDATVSSTITLQKSTVATALTVTYTADQTGIKEDTADSALYANTDKADIKIVVPTEAGTNTLTATIISVQFSPSTTTNTVVTLSASGSFSFTTASVTRFCCVGGNINLTATEANTKWRTRAAYVGSNLSGYVSANLRTTDVVISTRKNGGAGGQSITYASGTTGFKEDTSGTDTLAIGDDYNFQIVTNSGTESITFKLYSVRIVNTGNIFPLYAGNVSGTGVATGTTYFAIGGGLVTTDTTEANEQMYPRFGFTASELFTFASANTNASLACTVTLRNNTADGNLTVSYTTGQTGLKLDSAHTDSIVSGTGGKVDYKVINNDASGTVTFTQMAISATNVNSFLSRLALLGVG